MTLPSTDNQPAAPAHGVAAADTTSRTLMRFSARILGFAVVFVIAGELFFRFAIPAAELPISQFNAEYKFRRYDPAGPRTGRFTSGRYAQAQGVWRVNDQGWISHRDYLSAKARGKPAVAYLGSSFVEGFYSDVDTHIAARMEHRAGGKYDVYNFGMSDSVPSEHLRVAAYAAKAFEPRVLFFFCSSWHLAASLSPAPGRQRWRLEGGRVVDRPVSPLRSGRIKALAKRSAIIRYLVLNAHWRPKLAPANAGGGGTVLNAAQAGKGKARPVAELRLLAETLVRRAVAQHPGARVVVVTGGPYASDLPPQAPLVDQLLAQACRTYGAEHVDLLPAFHADWLQHHEPFQYAHDFHWNARAFDVIAQRLVAVVAAKPVVAAPVTP